MFALLFRLDDIIFFFFFNDTATTEIYTLSLHDALPICVEVDPVRLLDRDLAIGRDLERGHGETERRAASSRDRKSTRLNSSHSQISYAVFCLKKKKRRDEAVIRPRPPPTRTVSATDCYR